MADFIVQQMAINPAVTVDAMKQEEWSVGVSVEKWKDSSGTTLMYNGQGEYEAIGEKPNDRMDTEAELLAEPERTSCTVVVRSRSGGEQPLHESTTCAKHREQRKPPIALRSQ